MMPVCISVKIPHTVSLTLVMNKIINRVLIQLSKWKIKDWSMYVLRESPRNYTTFGMSLCVVTLVKPGPLNYKKWNSILNYQWNKENNLFKIHGESHTKSKIGVISSPKSDIDPTQSGKKFSRLCLYICVYLSVK